VLLRVSYRQKLLRPVWCDVCTQAAFECKYEHEGCSCVARDETKKSLNDLFCCLGCQSRVSS
jgi:hypothetical protein